MRGVHHQEVDAGLDQQKRPFVSILADADRRTDDQSAVGILGGVRERLALGSP